MADYAITGRKGSGKTLFAVGVIRDALGQGKRVATNLDVYLEHFPKPTSRATYTRLPDRPVVADLEAIGRGQSGKVEDDNGLIILDETSTFFNSRSFGDKDRQPLLDWLVHSRKLGWDVYYICQGLGQIDKQLRETMIEYHIAVKRTDKWPIPGVTPLARLVGLEVRFPKMHIGIVKHGVDRDSLIVERKWYRAHDLYNAFDTQQIFLDRNHPKATGLYTALSAWHLKGRYMRKFDLYKGAIFGAGLACLVLGLGVGYTGRAVQSAVAAEAAPKEVISDTVFVSGLIRNESGYYLYLSDGRAGPPKRIKDDGRGGMLYLVDNTWFRGKK